MVQRLTGPHLPRCSSDGYPFDCGLGSAPCAQRANRRVRRRRDRPSGLPRASTTSCRREPSPYKTILDAKREHSPLDVHGLGAPSTPRSATLDCTHVSRTSWPGVTRARIVNNSSPMFDPESRGAVGVSAPEVDAGA